MIPSSAGALAGAICRTHTLGIAGVLGDFSLNVIALNELAMADWAASEELVTLPNLLTVYHAEEVLALGLELVGPCMFAVLALAFEDHSGCLGYYCCRHFRISFNVSLDVLIMT